MKKIILDVTFNIPVRIDSPERLRNLKISTQYLKKYFFVNILIGEDSKKPQLKKLSESDGYIYYKNDTDVFHRTKILNDLARASTTPFVCNFDADILIPPIQMLKAIAMIRTNKADMILPYGGMAKNIIESKVPLIGKTLDISTIKENDTYEMNKNALGGAVLWNKQSFIKFGMENENFINWGYEDNERMLRAQKLGLKVFRVPGNLYHLDHHRNENDNFGQKYANHNADELNKVKKMKKDKLKEYIGTWEWLK